MMYDDEGKNIEVLHCHTNDAHRILSVILDPDDNNKLQVSRMKDIALTLGDNVRVGFIRGFDMLHALNSTVMILLVYALPAVLVTEEQ